MPVRITETTTRGIDMAGLSAHNIGICPDSEQPWIFATAEVDGVRITIRLCLASWGELVEISEEFRREVLKKEEADLGQDQQ